MFLLLLSLVVVSASPHANWSNILGQPGSSLAHRPFEDPNNICPDASFCPGVETCCPYYAGGYGCCLYALAVCCEDRAHCCPFGFECDVEHQQCKSGGQVVCPDGSLCESDNTCCQLASGQYGCCPLPDAVCCSDQEHCCPHGYTCDVEHQQCLSKNPISWFKKTTALRAAKVLP